MQASASTPDPTPPPPPQFPVFARAAGVCRQCRLSKTRCDKILPSCSRCLSKKARCVYGRQISADDSAGGVLFNDLEETVLLSQDSRASCIFEVSLDTCCKFVGMISVALLSGVDDAEQEASLLRMSLKAMGLTTASVVQTYRKTVHTWFPVVANNQISHFLGPFTPADCRGIDVMLFLSMALVSQPPCGHQNHDMRSNLYRAVKQSFMLLQTSTKHFVQVLQIGLLLSLFEYGHGLGRESELTVAACAAFCNSHRTLCVDENSDDGKTDIAIICRKAVVIMDCVTALPTSATRERTPQESSERPVTECHKMSDGRFEEACGSSSNLDVLFLVAGVVREATQYIKDEHTTNSLANSYHVVESRLRNICDILVRAAGPNPLMFCDSIALALSFLFELNVFHFNNPQAPVTMIDKLAIESSRRMAVDICRSMKDLVSKKSVDELSLIGLSVTCRAGHLLAEYDVGLCEGGAFTAEDLAALSRVQHDFTQRWRIGATYKNLTV
ncbi:hypothetical protein J3F83DRAFT_725233 [Trichoderma novae-zelandiae]